MEDEVDQDLDLDGHLGNSFEELPNADTSLNVPGMATSGTSFHSNHSKAAAKPIKMKPRKKSLIASKPIGFGANKKAAPK